MLKLQFTRKAKICAINTHQPCQKSFYPMQFLDKLIVQEILLACKCEHVTFKPVGVLVDHLMSNRLAGVRLNANIASAETDFSSVIGNHPTILGKHEDGEGLAPIASFGRDV